MPARRDGNGIPLLKPKRDGMGRDDLSRDWAGRDDLSRDWAGLDRPSGNLDWKPANFCEIISKTDMIYCIVLLEEVHESRVHIYTLYYILHLLG